MLLVIDVGNTNTVLGVYDGDVLVDHWRIVTEREKTADEWGILFRDLFLFDQIDMRDFEGMIISSVPGIAGWRENSGPQERPPSVDLRPTIPL